MRRAREVDDGGSYANRRQHLGDPIPHPTTLPAQIVADTITRTVELAAEYEGTAQDPFGNVRVGFTARTDVDREDFGLTWNAALETGGVLVSKKITLTLDISAIKQA